VAVLITGLGYLGVPLAAELLRRGEQVVGLENYFSTPPGPVRRLQASPDFTLIEGSVASARAVERACSVAPIRTIYHLAAQASAHPRAAPAGYTERVNLTGPRLVLEAAPRDCTVVFGSSFRVYGDELPRHVTEQECYGRMADLSHLSKIYAEKLLELYGRRDQRATVAVRLGIVYGLGPVMKTDPRFMTVPNLFCHMAAREQPLRVHPGATRHLGFIHLRDAVSALLAARELARSAFVPVNAVTELRRVVEIAALVRRLARERGLDVLLEGEDTPPPLEAPCVESSLDNTGFRALHTLDGSLGEVLDHFIGRSSGRVRAPSGAATR
jgi:nucleoside-diphosphate-sugar epimerase